MVHFIFNQHDLYLYFVERQYCIHYVLICEYNSFTSMPLCGTSSEYFPVLQQIITNFSVESNFMPKANSKPRKDSLVIYIALAFIAGFIAGAAFAVFKMSPSENQTTAEQQTSITDQQTQAITHLEQEVTANPDRFQAWTQLGNLYFDTGQYQKAVKAYEKSLDLHAGDANIWTDLGVMYRRTNQPEKAIEAFDKAISINPTHEVSRLNKGIVLMYDLGDQESAIESWENLLKINPNAKTGNGDSVREFVDHIKEQLPGATK